MKRGTLATIENPFHKAIADQVETLIRPDLVEWTPIHAQVETGGEFSAGKLIASAPGENKDVNAKIALRVDVLAAQRFIVERLLS